MSLSMLCWVVELPQQTEGNISKSGQKVESQFLNLQEFQFPIKFVEVFDQVLIDPTEKQEKYSAFEVSFIHNYFSKSEDPVIVQKNHQKGKSQVNEIVLKALKKTSK